MNRFFTRNWDILRQRFWSKLSADHRAGFLGVGWTTLSQAMTMVIRLGSTLILTRLLDPADYGLLGTAIGILVTLDLLSDMGITPALIRHPSGMEPRYLGTGWVMSCSRGLSIALLIWLLAPWVAESIYHKPELASVLILLGIRSVCHALYSPNYPALQGKLNYRGLFLIEFTQTLMGTAVSILMAYLYGTVWALVAGILTGEVTAMILTYVVCGRPAKPCWDRQAVRDIAGVSWQIALNTLVMALWLNFDRLLGLNQFSEREMGWYFLALNLVGVVEGVLMRWCDVYYAVLARRHEQETQERWHHAMSWKYVTIGVPLMIIGVILAPLAIRLLYDNRYQPAGILFGMLMIRLMIRTVAMIQYQYLMTRGTLQYATVAYGVAFGIQAVLFLPLVHHYGLIGMPLAGIISATGHALVQAAFLSRLGVAGLGPILATIAWMGIAGGLLAILG